MGTVSVYNIKGAAAGQIELPVVFDRPARRHLLWEAVQAHLTNARLGTAATKTRGLVRGGGKKPYRQKGTGRARHGSGRSPLFVGGGTTFGPQPRAFAYPMSKQARHAAVAAALAAKGQEAKVVVIDEWRCAAPKTKPAAALLRQLGIRSGLVVLAEPQPMLQQSLRNIPNVKVIPAALLNAYDLLRYDHLVLTKAAVEQLRERFSS
ncbi:MAG: 50S ribosomal protein L4 [Deltaproteobacteria bacterium]|nr:50S ribosomal protein L4 [Deltaproteobacteria bacterium]